MSRSLGRRLATNPGFPRVSGDEPTHWLASTGSRPFSLRERG